LVRTCIALPEPGGERAHPRPFRGYARKPLPWVLGSRARAAGPEQMNLLWGGNGTCTPVLASFVAACSSCVTALVTSGTPFLTSLHANGLSFGIRSYQPGGGRCDYESSSFPEERKGTSTRDGLCFDDFAHGGSLLGAGEAQCGRRSKMPVLM
jgi:hypothetical protein